MIFRAACGLFGGCPVAPSLGLYSSMPRSWRGSLAHRNHQGVEIRQKPGTRKNHGEKIVKDIRRATRKQYSAEEKIRIVLDGLKGEDSVRSLCLGLDTCAESSLPRVFSLKTVDPCKSRLYTF